MKSRNVGAMSAQKIIKLLADRGVLVVVGTPQLTMKLKVGKHP